MLLSPTHTLDRDPRAANDWMHALLKHIYEQTGWAGMIAFGGPTLTGESAIFWYAYIFRAGIRS